ncbi:NAD-dependent epimerase/dehydratase [Bacteriovoracaceae bacterium]|nr:NAD-dependent epimerase/dehydratase [Bacteriovoracaceae bacterium]
MSTLVTGANGYLGSHIVNDLIKNDNKVWALCRNSNRTNFIPHNKLNIIEGDITSSETIKKLTELNDIETIIHLVSLDHHKSAGSARDVIPVNVEATWVLLETFEKKNLKNFIYFSTQQVYGRIKPGEVVTEESVLKPLNQYGLTHQLSENIVNYYGTKGINCLNVRLSNSYGSPVFAENNCWWLVVNDLCLTAFKKQKIVLQSDGSPQRDFIHISDVSNIISKLIKNIPPKWNEINISSGETKTILELAFIVKRVYEEMFEREISIQLPGDQIAQKEDISLVKDKYTISNERLNNLNFLPELSLEVGIRKLFTHLISREND